MSIPASRSQFKLYCLRRLGEGVIKVNVSEDQVDDRVDYALQKFYDYHFGGTFHTYYPYQLQAADITNRFIPIPANIRDIVGLFSLSSNLMGVGIFNLSYQFIFTSLDIYRYMDMTNWVSTMQNIQQLEQLLVGQTPIRFNRYDTNLYIDIDWNLLNAEDFILLDCYVTIDPDQYPKVWADPWLADYATAQIKQQWGEQMKKYNDVQLVGGVRLNGQKIWEEATARIEQLELKVQTDYSQMPLDILA